MTDTNMKAAAPASGQPLLKPLVLILLAIWGLTVMTAAKNGVFDAVGDQPPFAIVVAALLPPSLFLLAYRLLGGVKAWVGAIDLGLVTAVQGWRVVGAAFVFTWGYGLLPGTFAIPAGYGDILVGLAAPFVALMIWQKSAGWRTAAYGLIFIGFLDFISAFAMGVILRENGPVYQTGDLHTGLLAEFPLTMIPSFLVPVFMILHIIAILKLRGR
ncbi:hypothetical protein [Tepidicaulis sp.]|uniref:hypothetical protein n=1 Tax=Tepidicaulis sp. TaxID=1920809 RepID=UPI003B5A0B93